MDISRSSQPQQKPGGTGDGGFGPPTGGRPNAPDPTRFGTPDPTGYGWLHLIVLGSAVAVSLLVLILLWATGSDFNFRHLATALFWALACLVSGMAVGFLFGIPRVNQGKRPADVINVSPGAGPRTGVTPGPPAGAIGAEGPRAVAHAGPGESTATVSAGEGLYSQRVNTNLEEISDWLTKIIVGLGLVELRRLPDHLHSMATLLGQCLGEHCSLALASGMIVWFSVMGFFIGYLPTRIYLSFVFSIADQMARDALDYIWANNAWQIVERKTDVATEELLAQMRAENDKLIKDFDAVSIGLAAMADNSDPALVASAFAKLTSRVSDDPTNPRTALILARLYRRKENDLKKSIEVLTRTIDAMEKANLRDPGYGAIRFNRACYNVLLGEETVATERSAFYDQAKVRSDLEAGATFSPSMVLQKLHDDVDLDPIRSETWFKQLLLQYPAPPTSPEDGTTASPTPTTQTPPANLSTNPQATDQPPKPPEST